MSMRMFLASGVWEPLSGHDQLVDGLCAGFAMVEGGEKMGWKWYQAWKIICFICVGPFASCRKVDKIMSRDIKPAAPDM